MSGGQLSYIPPDNAEANVQWETILHPSDDAEDSVCFAAGW